MKKLLLGFTLLTSMSSFSNSIINHSSCNISEITFERSSDSSDKLVEALETNKNAIVTELEKMGYHYKVTANESLRLSLDYQALEHQSCQGCGFSASDLIVTPIVYVSELLKKNSSITAKIEIGGATLNKTLIQTYSRPSTGIIALEMIEDVVGKIPDCNQI